MSVRGAQSGEFFPTDDEFAASADPYSLIDRDSRFEGVFTSQRDLRIEGQAKGTIECNGTLFIAEGAVVDATVESDHLTVAGELSGEVRCRGRLQLMPSGRLRGKVSTHSLIINEGAVYEGELDMPSTGEALPASRTGANAPVPISAASEARANQGPATTFIRRMGGPETPWETDEPPAGDTAERES
ncbi:MAG: polymer-forming cytoskeletal protein [Thermomicrobiales bacterium]|nr:polymer-forming cytoskeletal protein [Thermomicrobiales bacterium]